MEVFLLQHIHHGGEPGEVAHRDYESLEGAVAYDDEVDDAKIIGVYGTELAVFAAMDRARQREGFRDEPDCFMVDTYLLDEDQWTEGYVTLSSDDD
ncbi:hypothetical protein [Occultella kanbiaonis]|uniref:hypothetical protein n=1 Tax=Occultella kanbiaonis TaxID=2675754 RepID=UPI001A99D288|nr:hypothetical protein [Occultella kanbiaonis]